MNADDSMESPKICSLSLWKSDAFFFQLYFSIPNPLVNFSALFNWASHSSTYASIFYFSNWAKSYSCSNSLSRFNTTSNAYYFSNTASSAYFNIPSASANWAFLGSIITKAS